MNLLLLTAEDFRDKSTVYITKRRFDHIRQVLRLREGDKIKVGLMDGKMGSGTLQKIDQVSATISVSLTKMPPAPLKTHLIIALPRPPMIKRILFTASSMGVKQLTFMHSSRVEKSFWQSSTLTPEAIAEQLMLGLEQAGDTIMPQVHLRPRFKPFVEDELSALSAKTKKYIAHPDGNKNQSTMLATPATIVIGPEGGFIPYEVKKFNELGFTSLNLGARILRVETAVAVLLGRCK